MIVISPALVLSASPELGPNNPVIGWHNLVTISAVVADDADANYPATNLANASTNLRWQSDTTDEQYLTFTVVTEDEVDYVGLANHNLGTGQVTVSLEVWDGSEWDEVIPEFIPADDAPILMRFEPTFLTQIRVRLQPPAVDPVVPYIAVAYVGALLVLQRKVYVGHTPITFGRSADVLTGMSESGHFLGRVVLSERLGTSVSLGNLTPEWVRSDLWPFLIASKDTPFFFAWRPQEYPLEVGFAWMMNSPQPSNARSNGMMAVELQMTGIAL